MPKKREFDYELVEAAARTARNRKSLAIELQLGGNLLYFEKNDSAFAAAVARGFAAQKHENESAETAETEDIAEYFLTPEEFHRFGRRKLDHKEIGERLGLNSIGVSQVLHARNDLREAFEKGKKGIPLEGSTGAVGVLETLDNSTAEEILARSETENRLDERVLEAVDRKKLLFVPHISENLNETPVNVYNSLARLIAAKKIVKESMDDKCFYRLRRDDDGDEKKSALEKPAKNNRSVDEDGDYTGADLKKSDGDKLLASLREIKYQTSKNLCAHTLLSIGTVVDWLEAMCADGRVKSQLCGSVPAYYLSENQPAGKLFLGGGGKICECEPIEKPPVGGDKKIGDKVVLPKNGSASGFDIFSHAKNTVEIDVVELEQLAAQGMSLKQIAEEMEIGHSTLSVKINENRHCREAFERGRAEHARITGKTEQVAADPFYTKTLAEENAEFKEKAGKKADDEKPIEKEKIMENKPEIKTAEPSKKNRSNKPIKILDVNLIYELSSNGASKRKIVDRLGVDYKTFLRRLTDTPEVFAAFECGRKGLPNPAATNSAVKIETVKEDFLDHRNNSYETAMPADWKIIPAEAAPSPVEEKFTHSNEEVELFGEQKGIIRRVSEKLTETIPLPSIDILPAGELRQTEPPHFKEIELSSGRLKLSGDFNLFDTTPEERKFLFGLAEMAEDFLERRGKSEY